MGNYITLDTILSKDVNDLSAVKLGEFETENLGAIPYASISFEENKEIKRDCVTMVPDGTGGMQPKVDDDKMIVRLIVKAVAKDTRSDFTFADKKLINHLGVITADQAVEKLLSPGEIYRMGMAIQQASGYGKKAQKEAKDAVKNS